MEINVHGCDQATDVVSMEVLFILFVSALHISFVGVRAIVPSEDDASLVLLQACDGLLQ